MCMYFIKLDNSLAVDGYDFNWCRLSQVVNRSDGSKFITQG